MVNLFGALPALHQKPAKHPHYHCQQDIGTIVFLLICRMHHHLLQVKLACAVGDSHFWAGHSGTGGVTKQDNGRIVFLTN